MKAQKEKLKILRRFAADMKKALRAVKIQWQIVIEAYELKMSKRKEDRDRRKALAKKIKNKRYAPSEQNAVRFLLQKLEAINSRRRFNLPVRPVFAAGVVETVNFITPIFSALNA